MEKRVFFNALIGLFAYDTCGSDFGINDSALKHQVFSYINELNENDFRILFSEFIREMFVSADAIKEGYGIEDVAAFIQWCSNNKVDI